MVEAFAVRGELGLVSRLQVGNLGQGCGLCSHGEISLIRRSMTSSDFDEIGDELGEFGEDLDTGGVLIDDLSWRVEKLRLEEQNTKRFLRAQPRFLSYEDCRRWVQGWGKRWESKEDWRTWIAMGEKRNAYIPSRPDEYYRRLGQWISWEHFLGVEKNEDEDK